MDAKSPTPLEEPTEFNVIDPYPDTPARRAARHLDWLATKYRWNRELAGRRPEMMPLDLSAFDDDPAPLVVEAGPGSS